MTPKGERDVLGRSSTAGTRGRVIMKGCCIGWSGRLGLVTAPFMFGHLLGSVVPGAFPASPRLGLYNFNRLSFCLEIWPCSLFEKYDLETFLALYTDKQTLAVTWGSLLFAYVYLPKEPYHLYSTTEAPLGLHDARPSVVASTHHVRHLAIPLALLHIGVGARTR